MALNSFQLGRSFSSALCFWLLLTLCNSIEAHDGPDPRMAWLFEEAFLQGQTLQSQSGPNLQLQGKPLVEKVGKQTCLRLDGNENVMVAEGSWDSHRQVLPTDSLTVSAWVSVDEVAPNGAFVSCFQDNGNAESGWLLGLTGDRFAFALASEGGSDHDGKLTYLSGKSKIELGKWYHVCGVYDGETMQLWVNGVLDAESKEQHGKILYPKEATLALGCYLDSNESFPLAGRLSQVVIYDLAAKPAWVAHDFQHQQEWIALPPKLDPSRNFEFLVAPFLQYATTDSMTVVCELNRKAKVSVAYGETSKFTAEIESTSEDGLLHTIPLTNLVPETGYYYQVVVQEEGSEGVARSPVSSFQTASLAKSPFAFAVMGDTQGNPKVNGKLAEHIWALRPNFLLIPGDLVDDGPVKNQWVQEFFASMRPLFDRVVFYPVLGNHERNADHYYRYMALPKPEYYYSYQYGNAKFFVIDSNKKVDKDSEQYQWLERELLTIQKEREAGTSEIVWTFVTYHHPSYSSDEDDYGNLWKGKSTWGDVRIRPLTELFDRFGVDIVWNGHIHSYERTWPIRQGQVQQRDGTIYMITGGGGGGLEQAGPIRPAFQNNVRRGHHFVFVAVNGSVLELKAFDLDGKLYDSIEIRK